METKIGRNVSPNVRVAFETRQILHPSELRIDRSGSYATDGREDLSVSNDLVRSLLRTTRQGEGNTWYSDLAEVTASVCGTNEAPIALLTDGRQRHKAVEYINSLSGHIWEMWNSHEVGRDRVKLVNALLSLADRGRKGEPGLGEFAWIGLEDAYLIVGCEDGSAGFVARGLLGEDGPLPYCLRVKWSDEDPNNINTLRRSYYRRIHVETPPSIEARSAKRMLDDGDSAESVAAALGCSVAQLHDRLRILEVIPEVQAARDSGKITHALLRQHFFLNTRGGTGGRLVPRSVEEQRKALAQLVAGERPRFDAPLPVSGQDSSLTAKKQSPSTTGTLTNLPRKTKEEATYVQPEVIQIALVPTGYLPLPRVARARLALAEGKARLPDPEDENIEPAEWLRRKIAYAQVAAAEATLAHLAGDSTALSDFPDVFAALTFLRDWAALSSVEKEALAERALNLLRAWGAPDGKGWPVVDEGTDPLLAELLASLAVACDAQSESAEEDALEWVIKTLLDNVPETLV